MNGLDKYISYYHADPQGFLNYRSKWYANAEELLYLQIETNSHCNLSCPMCIHSIGYSKTRSMDKTVFDRIMEDVVDMAIPSVSMNQVNEPLLDKKIFGRIKAIAELDCVKDVMMNTNATLLNEESSRKIIDSGLIRLWIGFDGYKKETYEKMRRGASYEQVFSNVINFLELKEKLNARLPVVRLSFVKTKINIGEISDFKEFWYDKVDYLAFQDFVPPSLTRSDQEIALELTEKRTADKKRLCGQPFERLIVRGDGSVLPCCFHYATSMVMGNILDANLRSIWHSKKMAALRQSLLTDGWKHNSICSNCIKGLYGML
ncbi:radical SAM/SPASM domain-containing protein [Gemmatimonadota bacterium]